MACFTLTNLKGIGSAEEFVENAGFYDDKKYAYECHV